MEERWKKGMIKIYNTLTREKEVFTPIEAHKVRMYVCGPTVYNYIHIGNARSAIAFDTIRRYFEYRGYEVNYVSNFTDVDDKIIKAAKELKITAPEVAERFIKAFEEDTQALNVQPATLHPRVMDHMPDILAFIEVLIEKGFAYEVAGDVYYRTRKFPNYGKLSHQSIDELEVGASQRTGVEQQLKEDPLDFALENEIAQSEAKTGHTFANYWMHNGYVTIGEDDEKMSKSLGNFITVHEMIQKVDPQILRFFMSTTQYRRPIRYSESTLKEAAANYQKLKNAFENLRFRQADAVASLPEDEHYLAQLNELEQRFITEMDDDFNAANGITVVYELAKMMNQYSEQATVSEPVLVAMDKLFSGWLAIFGLFFKNEELVDAQVDALIEERNQARKDRDFARSDEIRDLLKEQGIVLEDTPQGTRWRRSE